MISRVLNCARRIFMPNKRLLMGMAMMVIVIIIVSSKVGYMQTAKYVEKMFSSVSSKSADFVNNPEDSKSADFVNNPEDSKSAKFFNVEWADESVAEMLKQRVRVLIWVMTSPQSLPRARAVKKTWGTKCDLLLFFSSANNTEIPTIGLDVKEGREHLFGKTAQAFDYIYENYFPLADWFMKADDDTFVVVENLRHFLYDKNASEPLLTGHRFDLSHLDVSHQSGGAGYVLSKEALRRYGTRRRKPPECIAKSTNEDVEMSRCLQQLGVTLLSSFDDKRRSHFHPYQPVFHVGTDDISEHAISFHHITPQQMSVLYYYIYRFRPFGLSYKFG
ncbi:hypothetical protein C0Q70_08468 [Pomacea canaliculata]|uniref:N-acetylgalactosaminide beta-1,3-galactosyltransferase n=1 Tax=Pomacea canaliculata TaxID=400727 RepID=A0A2T7PHZ9_POMCA|nr:glycoprotein-N-acetylgalactosamine 3-beta-galactosyltransferase 1-like [Pomacea canaliculata]PVD33020.1 hypothetical protein C0Q70_08468 [Pomacea canaliculata]